MNKRMIAILSFVALLGGAGITQFKAQATDVEMGVIENSESVDFYAIDYKAPEVRSVKVDKNVAHPGENIKLSVEVVDELSAIQTVQVSYKKPMSQNSISLFLEYNSDTGLYESIIAVDEMMEAGEWKIDWIFVCDSKDNHDWVYNTKINPYNQGKDLSQGNFTIKGTEGTADYKAPEVNSVKVDKNVAHPEENIKLSVEVVDELSAIQTVQVSYKKPMSQNSISLFLEYNPDTGLYESIIAVDEMMEAGEWKIDWIFVCDSKDNCDWVYNTKINPYNQGKDLSQGNFTILSYVKVGWLQDNNTWYYVKDNGNFAIGWEKVNGTWYYFNKSGAMQMGWLKEGSTWYYLKSSGAMATRWEKVNGTWYYFNKSGAMQTGWLKEGSTWYYLKSSGAMATGWEKVNGTWYYFNGFGKMAISGIVGGWKITSSGAAYKL